MPLHRLESLVCGISCNPAPDSFAYNIWFQTSGTPGKHQCKQSCVFLISFPAVAHWEGWPSARNWERKVMSNNFTTSPLDTASWAKLSTWGPPSTSESFKGTCKDRRERECALDVWWCHKISAIWNLWNKRLTHSHVLAAPAHIPLPSHEVAWRKTSEINQGGQLPPLVYVGRSEGLIYRTSIGHKDGWSIMSLIPCCHLAFDPVECGADCHVARLWHLEGFLAPEIDSCPLMKVLSLHAAQFGPGGR